MKRPDDPTLKYQLQLASLKEDFDAFRKRANRDIENAKFKGRDDAALKLLELVDDCDRALMHVEEADYDRVVSGLERLRDRTIRTFEQLGLYSFGEKGEVFDPRKHEAVSVESGAGPDGCILRIHRRGWQREDGTIVRTAMVTVLKGSESNPGHRQSGSDDYICPFGTPGCTGDCLGCKPPPIDFMEI